MFGLALDCSATQPSNRLMRFVRFSNRFALQICDVSKGKSYRDLFHSIFACRQKEQNRADMEEYLF